MASGARCGVFVLMSVDTQAAAAAQLPVARPGIGRRWRCAGTKGSFVWEHPDFGPLAAAASTTRRRPSGSRRSSARSGSAAKDAGRVEVPFSCIVPAGSEWWTADSRGGIDVPLGRAGAMKLQHLDLGSGTSQHVLISGKTGSGKSTLLHVLITNLALRYSPDEVELYLVDFKKGVEFKAYARSSCRTPG